MKLRFRVINLAMVVVLGVQLSGCGMILHPERQGQTGGRIDPAIALFDAAGLLLFIVPGLVAFGVDFYQGTIYLPGTASTGPKMIKMDDPSMEGIQKLLERQTGKKVDLRNAIVTRYQPDDKSKLLAAIDWSVPSKKRELAP